jgi:uncharacterized alkaline shock family protein YloU
MSDAGTRWGRIIISTRAIATIASQACLHTYGIVGMASRNLVDGISHLIARDPRHGVDVRTEQGGVSIELFLIVEYGTRISSVADSVAHTVRYQIERALGTPIGAVNVHIQDLRISDVD